MGNPKKKVLNKSILSDKARALFCALVALALCVCTEVPEHCGDGFPALNPEAQFCNQDNRPWDKCGGLTYNTNTHVCVSGSIQPKEGGNNTGGGGGTPPSNNGSNFSETAVAGSPFDMIFVQGGTFTMGCTSEQGSDCYSDESPTHSVTLSGYYIGKHEVTQGLWRAVMGNLPSSLTSSSSYGYGDNYPVYYVSWNDIVNDFLPELNRKTGRTYRLPTEAEWEYAARGRSNSNGYMYSGSNTIGDVAWYSGNNGSSGSSTYGTKPVGGKNPNSLGIYDMSGNVWEWVNDWYGSSYYSSSPASNPQGPGTGSDRVSRGGSWLHDAGDCRVSSRRLHPRIPLRRLGLPPCCFPLVYPLSYAVARSA